MINWTSSTCMWTAVLRSLQLSKWSEICVIFESEKQKSFLNEVLLWLQATSVQYYWWSGCLLCVLGNHNFLLKLGAFFVSCSNLSLALCHRCRYLSDQVLCHWVPNLCSLLEYRLTLFQLSDLRKGIRWVSSYFQLSEGRSYCCRACTVFRHWFSCSAGIYWMSLNNSETVKFSG